MSKKNKFKQSHTIQKTDKITEGKYAPTLSRRGKKTILAGIGAVVIGFIILAFADPEGKNLAATISPFVIILGYVTIGAGIILPDKNKTTTPASPKENISTPASNQAKSKILSTL